MLLLLIIFCVNKTLEIVWSRYGHFGQQNMYSHGNESGKHLKVNYFAQWERQFMFFVLLVAIDLCISVVQV